MSREAKNLQSIDESARLVVRRIRTLNLKGFDLQLLPGTLNVVSGRSGSGKSALLVHTLYALSVSAFVPESERRTVRPRLPIRPVVDSWDGLLPVIHVAEFARLLRSTETAGKFLTIDSDLDALLDRFGEMRCARSDCGLPFGSRGAIANKVQQAISAGQNRVLFGADCFSAGRTTESFAKVLSALLRRGVRRFVWDGKFVRLDSDDLESPTMPKPPKKDFVAIFDSLDGSEWNELRAEEGLRQARDLGSPVLQVFTIARSAIFEKLKRKSADVGESKLADTNICVTCGATGMMGDRSATGDTIGPWLGDKSEESLKHGSFEALSAAIAPLSQSPEKLRLEKKLHVLVQLGLERISPSRRISQLSSGERWKLAAAFLELAAITDTLFVCDEPERALHPQDLSLLFDWAKRMNAAGNTLMVSERNFSWSPLADAAFVLGPGSGARGGELQRWDAGTENTAVSDSFSADAAAREPKPTNNIRPITIEFAEFGFKREFQLPTRSVLAIVGRSGAGKTIFLRSLFNSLRMNRSKRVPWQNVKFVEPLRETASLMAEATGVQAAAAELFASLPAARKSGWKAVDFTLRSGNGRCEVCLGSGRAAEDEPGAEVICDACGGSRFRPEILQVTLQELSIADFLALSVSEALKTFSTREALVTDLRMLEQLGLGSTRLSATLESLSESERRRIALFAAIREAPRRETLYLLDQPFAGMDDEDIQRALHLLRQRSEEKSTFFFTSHQRSAIAGSHYVLELHDVFALREGSQIESFRSAGDFLQSSPEQLATLKEMREK